MITHITTRIDYALDRVTMYRLVLYVLLGLLGMAALLSAFALLPFTPLALLASAAFLAVLCWAANTILARIFAVPTNVESAFITALILALILDPARSPDELPLLGWAAILAMASKYLLALRNKHLFNPAAIAVVITAVTLGEPASWWIGTGGMLPAVVVGGWLLVRKLRQEDMVISFLAAALVTVCAVSLAQGLTLSRELAQLLVASPLFFFAAIMLTEPLTAPPTKSLKRYYALLVGVLIIPQIHVGQLYSTPELALVIGNVFAYLVGPKRKVVLTLTKKSRLSRDVVDFAFKPSERLAYLPGQYVEATLAHPHPDSRGNRRYFTLASSPTEPTIHLGVRFYQQSSTFKRALYALDGRAKMLGTQIAGDFTLPRDPGEKLVFIAGGIGITPFRSMLKYLLDTKQRRDIVLIYVNKAAGDLLYRDILSQAERQLHVKILYTLTDGAAVPRDWPGAVGRPDAQMIRAAVPDYSARTFYLSGPPDMVRAHEQVLKHLGIPHGRIKKDYFPGLV